MATPEIPYTIPKLIKGKRITTVPKGSTWVKEEAKQSWYIEFLFHNAESDKMERFRPTKNLNRLKVPKEKLIQFTKLCEAYKIALEGGWSPIDEKANDKLKRQVSSLNLAAAKILFEEYHIAKGTRKKSRQSYLSKVNQFISYYGQDKKVREISDYEITEFLNFMEKEHKWTGVTYNSSRIILNNYFKYLKVNKYISENPVTVVRYGRDTVAALSGEAWIDFVVRHGGSDWAGDSGRALLRCAYGAQAAMHEAPASPGHRERWLRGARAFVNCVKAGR